MITTLTPEQIAEIAHEANRAYAKCIGEKKPRWDDTTAEVKAAAIDGVAFRLTHPWASPEEQHEQWAKFKKDTGWTYGATLDAKKKTHPCLLPYAELPVEQKLKDSLYTNVLKTFLE